MTERTKLQRRMIAALAAGDSEKAKRIDLDIRCLDWVRTISGERKAQPGDEQYFKGVFLYFLKRSNRVDK